MKNISRGCVVRRWKNECAAWVFLTPYDASKWDIFHIKNNQLIILFILYLINIIIFNFSIYKCLMKKKAVPTLRQEVKVKVDIVTSDDIKIYYTGKFQDFTARYIIKFLIGWQIRIYAEIIFLHISNGSEILLMSILELFIDTFVNLLKRKVIIISLWIEKIVDLDWKMIIQGKNKWKKWIG